MEQNAILCKRDRFTLFVERLKAARSVDSFNSARSMLENILNAVEDEFSGVPYDPDAWVADGRLYPPDDNYRAKDNIAGRVKFLTRGHNVFFGENGSILIVSRRHADSEPLLDKPGKNGRLCPR